MPRPAGLRVAMSPRGHLAAPARPRATGAHHQPVSAMMGPDLPVTAPVGRPRSRRRATTHHHQPMSAPRRHRLPMSTTMDRPRSRRRTTTHQHQPMSAPRGPDLPVTAPVGRPRSRRRATTHQHQPMSAPRGHRLPRSTTMDRPRSRRARPEARTGLREGGPPWVWTRLVGGVGAAGQSGGYDESKWNKKALGHGTTVAGRA